MSTITPHSESSETSAGPLSPPLRLGLDDNGIVLTPDEFDAIDDIDEEFQYELVHGVVIVTPIPSSAERDPNEELGRLLRNFQESHPGTLDKTLFEQYVRTADSRRRADRVIWAGLGHTPDLRKDIPTIVVEFVSPSRRDQLRDYVLKRDEYLAVGVKEYWVIDRFARKLTVFRPSTVAEPTTVVLENESYRPSLLPGFELPLASLLKVADDWKQSS